MDIIPNADGTARLANVHAGEWAGDRPRMRPRIHEWTTLYSSIREIFVDGFSQTLRELREWRLSAGDERAGGHPRMKPRIHEWTTLYSSIREIFVDGFSQTLTELREWVMSAG